MNAKKSSGVYELSVKNGKLTLEEKRKKRKKKNK